MLIAVVLLAVLLASLAVYCAMLLRGRSELVAARDVAQERVRATEQDLAEQTAELDAIQQSLEDCNQRLSEFEVERARFEERERSLLEKQDEFKRHAEDSRKQFEETFNSLAGKALKSSQESFLNLAGETLQKQHEKQKAELEERKLGVEKLVEPLGKSLEKTQQHLKELEEKRTGAYAGISEQVKAIAESNKALKQETGRLVSALHKSEVRGRYGEIQLQRIVEIAGMREYCDFDTQHSTRDDEGALLRPDMVVRLPNDRVVIIDAKANIEAYLDAIEAAEEHLHEQAEEHLERFARHMLEQARALGKKSYWERVEGSPEFVVMFVPGDQFVDAALQRQPDLLDIAGESRVVIASPSTLIGLLRAVHVGWSERLLSERANELFKLGRQLHERAAVALSHADKLGKSLDTAIARYNDFVGSVETRMIPSLRKFEDAGARSAKTLEEPKRIERGRSELSSLPEPERDVDELPLIVETKPDQQSPIS